MRGTDSPKIGTPPQWRVPREWPGATVAILATGPSLTEEDVARIRARHASQGGPLRCIAIKEAYRLAPWADVLYGAAVPDWKRVNGAPDFAGRRVCMSWMAARQHPGLLWLEDGAGKPGLSADPCVLHRGANSTFQALNLAVLMGAARILFLGLDLRAGPDGRLHFFPNRERPAQRNLPFDRFISAFTAAAPELSAMGVEVINCAPSSVLGCFPRMTLAEALAQLDEAKPAASEAA